MLSFLSVKSEDEGTYRCIPVNYLGDGPEASVTVTVDGKAILQCKLIYSPSLIGYFKRGRSKHPAMRPVPRINLLGKELNTRLSLRDRGSGHGLLTLQSLLYMYLLFMF